MAEMTGHSQFDFDAAFIRRAFCYLERNITQDDFLAFENELRADPIKRKTLVELCVSQTELFEEFRQEAEFARRGNRAEPPENAETTTPRLPRGGKLGTDRFDPFLVLLERAGHGKPRDLTVSSAETSQASGAPSNKLQPAREHHSRRRWRTAAIMLLPLLAGIIFWQLHRPSNPAVISLALNARLDGSAISTRSMRLPKGPHRLDDGLMQVSLDGGAKIVVEGPSEFEVVSGSSVSLTSGRITARVPHGSSGLTVQTPDVVAVDLGTEFGVDVQPQKSTHVEVFEGHVRAEAHSATGPADSRTLGANEAAIVLAGSASIHLTAPTPLGFVRSDELAARAASSDSSGYQRWKQFSQQLRGDPDLIAYYPFDNEKEVADKLVNRAAATAGQHDGRIGFDSSPSSRPIWTMGRWPQKGALDFGVSGASAMVIPADPNLIPTNAITIAFWIKRSELKESVHLIFSPAGDKLGFNLALTGTDSALNRSLKPLAVYFDWQGHASALTPPSILPPDSRWCFVAITAIADGQTSYYVDGVLRATRPTRPFTRMQLGDLLIGRAAPRAEADVREIFQGSMDELAIFRRALSAEELSRMYEAGLPR